MSFHLFNPETNKIDSTPHSTAHEAQMFQKVMGLGGWIILEVNNEDELMD